MKCPSCGNKGKPDSRPDAGVPAAFEFRGRLGTKVIIRCLRCDRGVFVRAVPPGYKAIPDDQWLALDAFWQLRRAEILADLQVGLEFDRARPLEEAVAESQITFPGETQRVASYLHVMRQAGYASNESVKEVMLNRPAESARIALDARQQTVVHDGYEHVLAQGGAQQSERAKVRVAAAMVALADGEEGIRAFLTAARND